MDPVSTWDHPYWQNHLRMTSLSCAYPILGAFSSLRGAWLIDH